MAIELVTKFLPVVDELFATESKKSMLTNEDFDWTNAHTIKIYKVSTAGMNDYGRNGPEAGNWSRYGTVEELDATTQEMTLTRDRSFTFAIDKLDADETLQQVAAGFALARQLREVVVPEVDTWVYAQMCAEAGQKPTALELTAANIYDEIIKGSNALDNAEVPDTGRNLVVTPDIYLLIKKSPDIVMETDIGKVVASYQNAFDRVHDAAGQEAFKTISEGLQTSPVRIPVYQGSGAAVASASSVPAQARTLQMKETSQITVPVIMDGEKVTTVVQENTVKRGYQLSGAFSNAK